MRREVHLDDAGVRHVRQVRAKVFDVEDPRIFGTFLVDNDARRHRERRLGIVGTASVWTQ